jgi:anti-sigma factor RsiW
MTEEPTCRDLEAHASAFVDGELDPAEWDALRGHLSLCPPCDEYVRQLGLTIELLRRLPGKPAQEARAELVRRFEAWAARK